ncbi:carboxypeptidase regulatory-like domain-containing protein [Chondromyces crocatus]|uniref:PEGA domain-containing protein n=1 Tax=Chondromyces crocatus TaxID=52 RepID=A0A0K1EEH3_CHOCO|nr:carboxypeptidase regulatory-like domain-containing protein [Chondromyces crocatus]AKT39254.1 uncharacterized protein CMC5_034020 [Chondromyces crocatus]
MALGVALALSSVQVAAAAESDESDACVSSYENSQQLRRNQDLVHAKAELRLCLGTCPRLLARDCERWLKEVEPQIGRVTPSIVDDEGHAVEGATLLIDGEPVRIDRQGAVEVNPGRHTIRAESPGLQASEQEVEVKAGERAPLTLTLTRPPRPQVPPPVAPPPVVVSSTPVLGLTLGGAGLLGLGVGGALAVFGHLERSSLLDECAPFCKQAEADAVRRLWIAGGVSAGVGAVLLGVGMGLILAKPSEEARVIQPVAHILPGSASLGVLGRF